MRRRVALLVLCTGASHGADWRREAVPFYAPRAFVDGLYRGALQPRAAAFAEAAAALERALREHCDGPGDLLGARRQYAAAPPRSAGSASTSRCAPPSRSPTRRAA
jgi:hypothetical protein